MERLRIGVVGLKRGRIHVQSLLKLPNIELIGVADRYELRRDEVRSIMDRYGCKGEVLSEYDELLALKPDAVVLATHGKVQVKHAIQALEAGIHVLSEVPGAYTFEETVRLRDAVEQSGRIYMLGENASFGDYLRYWRKWVVEGRFGPISLAEAEYIHYLPDTLESPEGIRYTPRQAAAEGRGDVQPIWRADQPPVQYLTHDLGPLLEVLDDRVVSVTCRSGPWFSEEAPLRCDGQFALCETAKGTLIRILVALNCYRPSEHRYRIFGVDGGVEYFSYEDFTRRIDRSRSEKKGWERVNIRLGWPDEDIEMGHAGTDMKLMRTFVNVVINGRPSPIDVYRMADYTLPGIVAAKSAELGGVPLPVPNLHRKPFMQTRFWDYIPLPETEPEAAPYVGGW